MTTVFSRQKKVRKGGDREGEREREKECVREKEKGEREVNRRPGGQTKQRVGLGCEANEQSAAGRQANTTWRDDKLAACYLL